MIRRIGYLGAAAMQALLALGFVLQAEWARTLWPWPEGRLSYLFLGAVLAALATGSAITAASGRWRAALPSLIAVATLFGLLGLEMLTVGVGQLQATACVATALGALVMAFDALRLTEAPGEPPLAQVPRLSCAVFAAALVAAGVALVAGYPLVFPWPLGRESATGFGLIFLGLSLSYGLSALWAGRDMAHVALAGFLVYDLILLPPFLAHFAKVTPERVPSLIIYVAVLSYSAALAIWFLWPRGKMGYGE